MAELSSIKVKRRLVEIIRARLEVEIVVGLQGPRSVGKSTLLRQIATEAGVDVIDLDNPVKSGSRISGNDLGGLRKLRAALGNKFVGGIVLNTGERSYTPDERIHVLPIDRHWTPSSAL